MSKKKTSGLIDRVGCAPSHLSHYAQEEYKRVMKILVEEKMATTLDAVVLEGACMQYGIYRELYDSITDHGERSIADYIISREGNSQKQGELNAYEQGLHRIH